MSRSASEPLRALTEEEREELQRVSRASSESRIRHQRAVALLAVVGGKSLSEAARLVGWKSHDPVTKVTRRFNSVGVCALSDLPRLGPQRQYGPEQQARILQEARRTPDRKEDATGSWSLSLLQRALRAAPDGLPRVSTFTILHTLHEAGYTWQKNRTWCHSGRTLKKGKDGTVYQSEDPYTGGKKNDDRARLSLGRAIRFALMVSAMRRVRIKPSLIPVTLFSQRDSLHAKIISTYEARPANCSHYFDRLPVSCERNQSIKVQMLFCIPGSKGN